MLSTVYSAGLAGIDGFIVTVECDTQKKSPVFEIVGLPDTAIKESRERVRSACENSGFHFPNSMLTVNLAPADKRKEGSALDVAILLGILHNQNAFSPRDGFAGRCFVGELSLSGELKPVRGVLSMTCAAKEAGFSEMFVPMANATEAAAIEGITVFGVHTIRDILAHLTGKQPLAPIKPFPFCPDLQDSPLDFADVKGQSFAKRAMEIAAAGGHNVLMIGAPGTGKSMLAKRLPSILPPLSFEEAVETTKVHSVAGLLSAATALLKERPFRSPHHTMSATSLVGGGRVPTPGEISLANHGVLFLDELPEFQKQITDTLRQPIEDGKITITRVGGRITYPCSFMLVAAMNPCRCGYFGHPTRPCTCKPADVKNYMARISGPLLDRIDIQIELDPLSFEELNAPAAAAEHSYLIRERVISARELARRRYADEAAPKEPQHGASFSLASVPTDYAATLKKPIFCNAQLDSAGVRKYCVLTDAATAFMKSTYEKMGLSGRGYDRILRVARTIADLDRSEKIDVKHLAEAVQFRSLDKKYWG